MGGLRAIGVAVLSFSTPALAASERSLSTAACPAPAGEAVVVIAGAVDATAIRLADGRLVRLAGIEAPLSRPGHAGPQHMAVEAQAELGRLSAGVTVRLLLSAGSPDRYGTLHGDLTLADGRRLSAALVASGLALVRVTEGENACFVELLAAERAARAARRGIWAGPDPAIRKADEASLGERHGLYELVEGRVVSVGHGTRVIFLDFGRDYRRDFTVMLAPSAAAKLAVPVDGLARRRIRVRGIIEENNGPAIRVSDPAAIELLDEEDGAGSRN